MIRAVTLLFLLVVCLIGFSAAASHAQTHYAIDYLASERSHSATMMVNNKADVVWKSLVDLVKKRNPGNLNIKKENIEKLKFEASKKTKSGEMLYGSIKARPVSEFSCRLIVAATVGGTNPLEQDMKDFVQDTLLQFCNEQGYTCNIK